MAPLTHPPQTCATHPPRRRRIVVTLIAAFISLGSIASILLDLDLWPWSNYPMYREIQGDRFRYRRAVGVLQDGTEVPLTHEQVRPFTPARMNRILRRLGRRPDAHRRLTRVMQQLTHQARTRGATDRIVGARAYDLHWTLTPGAVNRDHPDQRILLAEYLLPQWSNLATTRPIELPRDSGDRREEP
jgi:hypothetical protein